MKQNFEFSTYEAAERFATLLFHQLLETIPRPGTNQHKYSHGATFDKLRIYITNNGFRLVLSEGVDYSTYEFGYREDGSRRTPRGKREAYNFKIVERCIRKVANIMASHTGGRVIYL